MLNFGLMGLGAIGVDVEKMVARECKGEIKIPAILVKNPRADRSLNRSIITTDFDDFIKTKPDVILEVAVALAGLGLDKTKLAIIVDIQIDTHVCEIQATGAFGSYEFRENLTVAETNRKTGKIVGMALMKTIKQMVSPVVVGV